MSPEAKNARTNRRAGWSGPVALALLAVGVFWQAQSGEFLLWDDDINIGTNPHLRSLSWENLRWMFTDSQRSLRYTPLAWLGWGLTVACWGLSAAAFHWGNLLFHAVNGMLLFWLIEKLLPRQTAGAEDGDAWWRTAAAGLGALVWVLHPLRTEVVAWATARTYAQAIFFLLLAALAYVEYVRAPTGSWWRRRYYWAAVVAFAGSLLTYPLAVGFVPVLLVMDVVLLGRMQGVAKTGWRSEAWTIIRDKIPLVVATLALVAVTLWTRAQASGMWEPLPTLEKFGVAARTMQAFYIWAYFGWKQFSPADLSPVYTRLIEFSPGDAPFVASLVGVMAVSGVLWWKRREWPGVAALWACHLVLLVPTLGITEHPYFTSDRYSYLVALPWAVALGRGVFLLLQRPRWRAVTLAVGVLAATGCGVLSMRQVRVWHDSESLFRHVLGKMGQEPYRAGIAMRLAEVLRTQGREAEAIGWFQAALQVNPNLPYAHGGLAKTFETQGRRQMAMAHYGQVVRLSPAEANAHYRLGVLLFAEGKAEEAAVALGQAVKLDERNAHARADFAAVLIRLGRLAEAVEQCEAALRFDANVAAVRGNLGAALVMMGRPGDAIPHYEHALRLSPESVDVRFDLADALRTTKRIDEAMAHYREVLRIKPDHGPAHLGLGVVWLMAGRPAEAIPHLTEAVKIQPRVAGSRLNLGIALREIGRIAEAKSQFAEALRVQPGFVEAQEAMARLPEDK